MATGSMTAPAEGFFRFHLEDGAKDFSLATEAFQHLEKFLQVKAISKAKNSGVEDLQIFVENDIRKVNVEANEMLFKSDFNGCCHWASEDYRLKRYHTNGNKPYQTKIYSGLMVYLTALIS